MGLGEPMLEGRALTVARPSQELEPYLIGQGPHARHAPLAGDVQARLLPRRPHPDQRPVWRRARPVGPDGQGRGTARLQAAGRPGARPHQDLWSLWRTHPGRGPRERRQRAYRWFSRPQDRHQRRAPRAHDREPWPLWSAWPSALPPCARAPAKRSTSPSTFMARSAPQTSALLIKALEPYQPLFIEEPVQCQNVDVLADLARRTHIPIATGERLYTKWGFREVLEKRAASILQPDIAHVGGIFEGRLIAGMARGLLCRHRAALPAGAHGAGRLLAAGCRHAQLFGPGAGHAGRGLSQGALPVSRMAMSRCPTGPAWASSWTRRRWPTRSAMTGRTRSAFILTTARRWTGERATRNVTSERIRGGSGHGDERPGHRGSRCVYSWEP